MSTLDVESLRQIKTLPSLVKFLRDELDWPVEADEIDDLTFDYAPEELGLDAKHAAKIKEIKQLRPLDTRQPWGIFWVSFEKKRLPMVVLRRILGNLIIKTRAGARKADRPSWHLNDLLFISSYGEEEHRTTAFAHFAEDREMDELPVLRVLGWDDQNSIMHLDRVANRLHSHFRWPSGSEDVNAWRRRWSDAFTDRYREAIQSADELIPRLAALAAGVRRRVRDVLDAETERGPMRRLYAAVQKLLIHDLSEDGFADMYAQTVAYGLLSARFSRPEGLTAQNLVQLTAVSNPFLENLLENLFRLNRGKFHFDVDEVGINDVLDLLRNTNIEAIKAAFSDKNPAEDPVIRFYEGFLKQYDPQQRIRRGVFFTPRPVVSYIVRSVHELLQTEFGLEDGLASTVTWGQMERLHSGLKRPTIAVQNLKTGKAEDMPVSADEPFVQILDPAVGTGTFLFESIEVIERTMKDKWCRELGKKGWSDPEIVNRWREYVPRHLLPRLYGFELMMAPYAIAHLKLALKLGETGYQFQEGDRLNIYLTNSLEPPTPLADAKLADMFTILATEAQEVNRVKATKRFTVVIGNPPYAGHAANFGKWITQLVDDYYYIDGKPLGEKNPKWLQDDYVKFVRMGQFCVCQSGLGVFSYITNHGYMDNPTFRGMRQQLTHIFANLYIHDLHGNAKKAEKAPDGSIDKNVFDIQMGVGIFIFVKEYSDAGTARVARADLWGAREAKYKTLAETDVSRTNWQDVRPSSPFYLFVCQDADLRAQYEEWWKVTDMMPTNTPGVVTGQDSETIALGRSDANKLAVMHGLKSQTVRCILYRPLDVRYVVYDKSVVTRTRNEVMRHMLAGENIGLVTVRRVPPSSSCNYFSVSACMISNGAIRSDNQSIDTLLPLYLYPTKGSGFETGEFLTARRANFSSGFVRDLTQRLKLAWLEDGQGDLKTVGPLDVLHYAYAVFHSPTYRSRYAEFLKIDFPRLPLTSSLELFRALAKLGGELVALHLMESPKLNKPMTKWRGETPGGEVEKVAYADETVWIDKAQTEGFRGVPEAVWNFHIGGYQVCQKWLKDRKARQLSADDIAHYQKIVVALSETIRLMAEIDKTIDAHGGWPNAFAAAPPTPDAGASPTPFA